MEVYLTLWLNALLCDHCGKRLCVRDRFVRGGICQPTTKFLHRRIVKWLYVTLTWIIPVLSVAIASANIRPSNHQGGCLNMFTILPRWMTRFVAFGMFVPALLCEFGMYVYVVCRLRSISNKITSLDPDTAAIHSTQSTPRSDPVDGGGIKNDNKTEDCGNQQSGRLSRSAKGITFGAVTIFVMWLPYTVLLFVASFCDTCLPDEVPVAVFVVTNSLSAVHPLCHVLLHGTTKELYSKQLRVILLRCGRN